VNYSYDDDREGVKLKVNPLHSIDFTIQTDLNDYRLVMVFLDQVVMCLEN
jgi:hypothetical protein